MQTYFDGTDQRLITANLDTPTNFSITNSIPSDWRLVDSPVVDSDADAIADFRDLDSDGDGIADTIEARGTVGFVPHDGTQVDADGDGILDPFDSNDGDGATAQFGGSFTTPVNTDGSALFNSDTTPDFLDTDSDGDFISDAAESGLTLSGVDANSDGIDDDASIGASFADPDGVINDPLTQLANVDSDDADVDFRSLQDTDGDSVADAHDVDDDNDGITDTVESTVEEFSFGNQTLSENNDGSGSISVEVNDRNGNQLGSIVFDYFGFTGVGGGAGGGDGSVPFTPTLVVGEIDGEPAFSVEYANPNINEHNFGYSIRGEGIEFEDVRYNLQGVEVAEEGAGRTEEGVFTVEHDLDSDPIVTENTNGNHQINGMSIAVGASIADGTAIDRTVEGTSQFLNLDFDLGFRQSFGVNALFNNGGIEGIESVSFSFRGAVVSDAVDTDRDGTPDRLDVDSDNDGILDNVEAQTDAGFIAPDDTDTPADYIANQGLNSAYVGTNGLTPVDTDSDLTELNGRLFASCNERDRTRNQLAVLIGSELLRSYLRCLLYTSPSPRDS